MWIAGDIVIGMNFAEEENAKRWGVRLLLFMILASQYVVLRSRGGNELEIMEIDETLLIEREPESVQTPDRQARPAFGQQSAVRVQPVAPSGMHAGTGGGGGGASHEPG